MKILSIETSCDETAVAIIECNGGFENPSFKILGNSLLSQIEIHKEYGGVFPSLAKREHAKNLVPLLENTLKQSSLYLEARPPSKISDEKIKEIEKILEKESGLFEKLKELLLKIEIPNVDTVAVTYGPGLEPALWVGLNFAKALSIAWNKPLTPVNHMEGHIFSVLMREKKEFLISNPPAERAGFQFPMISLLISGGHTELVLIKDWLDYEIIGQTRDDAVGEAFDKVARMLGLPYPGGPEISKLAEETRNKNYENKWSLPRPMISTDGFDFSFSGLKTSVLYKIKKLPEITDEIKKEIAREFEDAVVDVLISKTKKALQKYNAKTLIIGGGVVANKQIRQEFTKLADKQNIKLMLPENSLSTDNAVMIGIAGYFRFISNKKTRNPLELRAEGNLRL
ncbi:MAG: O-sialoglycoprotein endopeptidase [Parcubacteria group bacterium Athens0714_16]|nr:MAG: O-sialoglycoprotein endopeptidase [Parcubacteria group bacterium Athens0714_16]